MLRLFGACALWTILTVQASYTPFKRNQGTVDASNWYEGLGLSTIPLMEAPIFGLECNNKDCDFRRFLNVRLRNEPIVVYSNFWITAKRNNKKWSIKCPKNMLVVGLGCFDEVCASFKLSCGRPGGAYRINSRKKRKLSAPNKPVSLSCPDGMYADGIECLEMRCTSVGLYCVELLRKNSIMLDVPLLPDGNRWEDSGLFDDGFGGYSRLMPGPVNSITCSGLANCDYKNLHSVLRGIVPMLSDDLIKVSGASWEKSSIACPKGTVMRQMYCKYSFCAMIDIGCSSFINSKFRIDDDDVRYSDYFSTTYYFGNVGRCPDGYYVKGIQCHSQYCGTLGLECVKVSIRE